MMEAQIISIHAPRGGSDRLVYSGLWYERNFNPRSPWGERLCTDVIGELWGKISIHAPRGGSDAFRVKICIGQFNFNPRSPWGERPLSLYNDITAGYFNPRSPWGERRYPLCGEREFRRFQSTLPVGGATFWAQSKYFKRCISIHAPRGGSDTGIEDLDAIIGDFNPRSPWGERRGGGTTPGAA